MVAAGCLFPLQSSDGTYRRYGTRHRAAIGLSEVTDAVVLVVSEERGSMRIALGGRLGPDLNGAELREQLRSLIYDRAPFEAGNPATQPGSVQSGTVQSGTVQSGTAQPEAREDVGRSTEPAGEPLPPPARASAPAPGPPEPGRSDAAAPDASRSETVRGKA